MPFSGRRSNKTEPYKELDEDTTSVISFHSNEQPSTSEDGIVQLGDPRPELTSGAITLIAHNINYYIQIPTRFWQKEQKTQILSTITGIFMPGLSAILGDFGSGKTSLLNVLADRVDRKMVDGAILINGQMIPNDFRFRVGFVAQNDILKGTLTVRENIAFSAALRLPQCLRPSERSERVNCVIRELGLENCADTKIGSLSIRGVSQGEKKRCSIGMELVTSPPILFLDEPTRFLDPVTANTIIVLLKRLSEKGRTIILSIDQPRFSAYKFFDNILLLSLGNTVFHGTPDQALTFFEKQGFKCPAHNNPSDFFLEVINADQSTVVDFCPQNRSGTNAQDRYYIRNTLVAAFLSSHWCTRLHQKASQVYTKFERRECLPKNKKQRYQEYNAVFYIQFLVLAWRSIKNLIRDPLIALTTLSTTIFFSLVMIGIYWQLEENPITGFSDRSGVLFFVVLVQLFFNISSLEKYFRERLTLVHENTSGFYRISVYFVVKIVCDMIPLRLIAVWLMSLIVYFAVGLRNSSESFFLFVFSLFLITMTAASISFFVASTFRTFPIGQMMLSLVYMMMMLFSGYMINLGTVSGWISWMQYLSLIKYGLTALYINEFKDRTFCDGVISNTTCKGGNSFLSEQDMDYESVWDLWKNYFALIVLSLGLFSLSYIQLRRTRSWT